MHPTRLAQAIDHARSTLADGLDKRLAYHSLFHTAGEVVPAVQLLIHGEQVVGDAADLLVVAAWYHDIGFTVQADGHERIGATIAADALPSFGFSEEQVDLVAELVLATHVPQRPTSHLQQILCDADLCSLGQPSFRSRSSDLRREQAALTGVEVSDEEWATSQAAFLAGHQYFTDTARALWGERKSQNLLDLRAG